jgi:hypothetical protein
LLQSPSNDLKLEIDSHDQGFGKRILAPFVVPVVKVKVKIAKHDTPNFFRIRKGRTRAFFFQSI